MLHSLLLLVKRASLPAPAPSKLAAGDNYFFFHTETARRVLALSPLLGAKRPVLLSVQIALPPPARGMPPAVGLPLGDI